ncbi:2Fe-2S iron-sulfur cluster-binding protein [Bordetella sp. N]|uniref:2Fe-2S iron-sulfur cluster-binding protein n=1 Tax=Bordetella sp. N TaxID=1746199 RepID=UPI000AFC2DAA|nr:2Fe-2S iron-sulfur cluster-binding protein [Bordetella sp. N]
MQDRHLIEIGAAGQHFRAGNELLLDAALAQGMAVPFSCRRGECGCCKVRVLQGTHAVEPYAALGTPYPLADGELLLCQSRACSDLRIDIPGWSMQTPALRFEAIVQEKRDLAAGITRLAVKSADGKTPAIQPGQYMKLYLPDGSNRCFSVANIPAAEDGQLEFHIRRVAGGRFSEGMLDTLRQGDRISLEGGFGACTWQGTGHAHLVLFATGTGYAGIKPILLAALASNTAAAPPLQSITLYWGGNGTDDFYDQAFLDTQAATDPRF